ncbi:MAG: hypothetical protein JXA69_00860 [Phycisphaerae bacterium]|nr:hypothetical protein [Phycisphaerae bacterium]
MPETIPASVVDFVLHQAGSDLYAAYCRNRLLELLESDAANAASPETPLDQAAIATLIENEIRQVLGDRVTIERRPHAAAGAFTLVVRPQAAESAGGTGLFFTTRLCVRPPTFMPRSTGERVFGRGAAGTMAQVAMILGHIKLLAEVGEKLGSAPRVPLAYHFVVGDDRDADPPADADSSGWSAVVLESTSGIPHTTQPGAVTFKCTFQHPRALLIFPFVAQAISAEGDRLRAESPVGPLPATAMRTNHGRLGCYGDYPDLACDRLAIRVKVTANANPERIAMRMTEVLDATVAEYVRHRIDLTKQTDPATGEPKLRQHYALAFEPARDTLQYRIDVFGHRARAGAADADSAIAKAAFMFGALLRIGRTFPKVRADVEFADELGPCETLVLEGVQTFGPPPSRRSQVRERLIAAVAAGVAQYRQVTGEPVNANAVRIEFGRADHEPLQQETHSALWAAYNAATEAASLPPPDGTGWIGLSPAAALAAHGHPAVIFGPGSTDRVDARTECVEVPEIQRCIALTTLAALAFTPTS